jgi:hypothetical protein
VSPEKTYDAKREFLADVSSFANTAGGHLVYGISEAAGIPTGLPGVVISDFDAEKLRLENLLRDGILPRISGIARSTVVLHMIPLTAFETGQTFSAIELTNTIKPGEAFPIYSDNAFPVRVNFDGLVVFATFGDGQSTSYLQVFKNGIVESVSAELMYGSTVIHGAWLEGHLVRKSVPSYLKCLQKLKVPPPIFAGLSLVGVASHTMEAAKPSPFGQPQPLGRDILILPEVVFETYGADVATTLKPVFDSVWNAAGKVESPFYEGNEWKGMTKFNPNLLPW